MTKTILSFNNIENIREDITYDYLRDIVDCFLYNLGIDRLDPEFIGRFSAVHSYNKLPNEFIYWFGIVTLINPNVSQYLTDPFGKRGNYYYDNLAETAPVFLGTNLKTLSPETAYAYALTQFLLSYPSYYSQGWLNTSVVEDDAQRLVDGSFNIDLLENLMKLEQTLWYNFVL